jgi:hypothetical protein
MIVIRPPGEFLRGHTSHEKHCEQSQTLSFRKT